jgi:hypothetical protein
MGGRCLRTSRYSQVFADGRTDLGNSRNQTSMNVENSRLSTLFTFKSVAYVVFKVDECL